MLASKGCWLVEWMLGDQFFHAVGTQGTEFRAHRGQGHCCGSLIQPMEVWELAESQASHQLCKGAKGWRISQGKHLSLLQPPPLPGPSCGRMNFAPSFCRNVFYPYGEVCFILILPVSILDSIASYASSLALDKLPPLWSSKPGVSTINSNFLSPVIWSSYLHLCWRTQWTSSYWELHWCFGAKKKRHFCIPIQSFASHDAHPHCKCDWAKWTTNCIHALFIKTGFGHKYCICTSGTWSVHYIYISGMVVVYLQTLWLSWAVRVSWSHRPLGGFPPHYLTTTWPPVWLIWTAEVVGVGQGPASLCCPGLFEWLQ